MGKTKSILIPPSALAAARANAEQLDWVRAGRDRAVAAADPWRRMSDDDLWALMFGPEPQRSWNVWYNGNCPLCGGPTPMYNWRVERMGRPWKVFCPHCHEAFPRNDFGAYYRSGLGPDGLFDRRRGDRSLLFNADHPDPADPRHQFAVDDGWGWPRGDAIYHFVGFYIIDGRWRGEILAGIAALAEAHLATGEPVYAHKAGVLLDRVADVYPLMDFKTQAVCNEGKNHPSNGYVSMWHDACGETEAMALAYDTIFDALRNDRELVAFLAGKAARHGLTNPKSSFADVQRNIEDGLLRDPLAHREKIYCNFPSTDCVCATLETILDWPANHDSIVAQVSSIIERSTQVDGVTGEKGLNAYSRFVINTLASTLQVLERAEPGFLKKMVVLHPVLARTWRFWIDTWCLQRYYPTCGDAGWFAHESPDYLGVQTTRPAGRAAPLLRPSMFTFLWRLYEATGDVAMVQAMYRNNGDSCEGLPWDAMLPDPAATAAAIENVIQREGTHIKTASVNLQQWNLAILRSGKKERERAVWLDYDSGGKHGHFDALNLGLYAFGLDLMPDLGYPPIQYGVGADTRRVLWYRSTRSHNTVVIDNKDACGDPGHEFVEWISQITAGATTSWHAGPCVRAISVDGRPFYTTAKQYERTLLMVDISDDDFYLLDIFRVVGGSEHVRFTGSHFGGATTEGLNLRPAEPYSTQTDTVMKNFRTDPAAAPGWSVDWKIEDHYKLLDRPRDIHLRLTDLTNGAEAGLCDSWLVAGSYDSNEEHWLPRAVVRRRGEEGTLATTFVSVVEPYEGRRSIVSIRRLDLKAGDGAAASDADVAVEVTHTNGTRDVLIATDVEAPLGRGAVGLAQRETGVELNGRWALVRFDRAGAMQHAALSADSQLRISGWSVTTADQSAEIAWINNVPQLTAGAATWRQR